MSVKVTGLSRGEAVTFDRPNLLLVEGADDVEFFKVQLNSLKLAGEFQIHAMNGNTTDWRGALEVIVDDDWFSRNGQSIGLVRDADTSEASTVQSCAAAITAIGLAPSSNRQIVVHESRRHGILVLPGGGMPGALEEHVIGAIDPARVALASTYLADVTSAGFPPHTHPGKSKLQAVLAGYHKVTRSLAVATQRADLIPAESTVFDSTRHFLNELAGIS